MVPSRSSLDTTYGTWNFPRIIMTERLLFHPEVVRLRAPDPDPTKIPRSSSQHPLQASTSSPSKPRVSKHLIIQSPPAAQPFMSYSMNRRSRKGCLDCKRAKVKCDEVRPACGTCYRRGYVCQGYANINPQELIPGPIELESRTGVLAVPAKRRHEVNKNSMRKRSTDSREHQSSASDSDMSTETNIPAAEKPAMVHVHFQDFCRERISLKSEGYQQLRARGAVGSFRGRIV